MNEAIYHRPFAMFARSSRKPMSSKGEDEAKVEDSFNSSRAELFEALGHSTRIRLVLTTDEGKESLRIVEATTQSRREGERNRSSSFISILTAPFAHLRHWRAILLAILFMAIILWV